jgi:hypothetical protein
MLLIKVLRSIKQDLSLVVFPQKEGIDYEETFAPVARYTSIRTIIALAAKMKWKLYQMDVPVYMDVKTGSLMSVD